MEFPNTSIIYVSCVCSKKYFSRFFKNGKNNIPGQQVQKYHRLLVEGIIQNHVDLHVYSTPPITRANTSEFIIRKTYDIEESVNYNYSSIINIPVFKNFYSSIVTFLSLKKILRRNRSTVICDVLHLSSTLGALLATKVTGARSIGIITDIPTFLYGGKSLKVKLNEFLIRQFDSYIVLTEEMITYLQTNKPYKVIEGQVDIKMINIDAEGCSYNTRVIIYAGAIQKKYGIELLVRGFIEASLNNCELHIYGNGDYEEELISICNKHNNIKYFGVVPNDEIIKAEINADLLVNPRPTTEEFTKYSFPSKNMEYMVSGTPVLTTVLPGMPKEYYEYVYLIKNESISGIAEALTDTMLKSEEDRYNKGTAAKEFVLKTKNNVIQSRKIIDLVHSSN